MKKLIIRYSLIAVVLLIIGTLYFYRSQIYKSYHYYKYDHQSMFQATLDERPEANKTLPFYVCDSFAINAINKYEHIDSVLKNCSFMELKKIPEVNRYDESVIDTLFTFSDNNNIISFIKDEDFDCITHFKVYNNNYKLLGGVETGMSQSLFMNKFNIDHLFSDSIQIGDISGTNIVRFYFNNSKLNRIELNYNLE